MSFELEVQKTLFSKTTFFINEKLIRFDNKEILLSEITGLGYMSTQTSVNGIPTSKTFEINLWLNNDPGPRTLRFSGAFKGGAANDKFGILIDKLWDYFGNDLLNQLHRDLLNGKVSEMIPGAKLTSNGIVVLRQPWFSANYEILAPWNDLSMSLSQGFLTIKSQTKRKARISAMVKAKNMWILYNYVNWLIKNPTVIYDLMAVHNNYELLEKKK
jgi:hypothetical protein